MEDSENTGLELSEREQAILSLVAEAYIETGRPVSSKTVSNRRGDLRLSPATVRACMVELTAKGLLVQPHVSAGRAPTELGMRVYLDCLMSPRLRPWDRTHLAAAAEDSTTESFPADLTQALATLSRELVVVGVPRIAGATIREIGLARVSAGQFLAVFVSPGGYTQQKLVEVDFDLIRAQLMRIQNFLNERLTNRTLGEIRRWVRTALAEVENQRDSLKRSALEIGLRALPEPEMDIMVDGAAHLAGQPEFRDLQRLYVVLRTIEDRAALLELLSRILDSTGVTVMLGSEHHVAAVPDLAMVGSTWISPTGLGSAAVAVIGPARMDYGRLVPLVGYATELFGRYWERL